VKKRVVEMHTLAKALNYTCCSSSELVIKTSTAGIKLHQM
jgi:hypothetical protein